VDGEDAQALPQLVWSATPDGACDYFSTQWTKHTGVPESELLGWRWLDVLHPDDREPTRTYWTDSVAGRGPYDVEYRVRRSDGEYRWFKTRGVPIRDEMGKIGKWFGTCTDITASKHLEEELRQVNARLDLAVRGSNLAIWEFDLPDGRIENSRQTFINVWESLGYDPLTSPADFDSGFALAVHPDDQERRRHEIPTFLASEGREVEAEYRVRHKDGSDRWRLARGVALRDAEGRPLRFIGSFVEITERKRAEEALRESEQRFRTFVDHATDAFFRFDDQNVILDVNRQACQGLGYTRDELLGMTPIDLDPDVTPARLEEMTRKLDDGELMTFASRHRRKDGTLFPVAVRGQAFWEGGRRFTVALARDTTDRKRAEEALRESEERFRGTFENAAVGIAHVDAAGRFLRVNEKFCGIVGYPREELLDFAKIEAGRLDLDLGDFSLRSAVGNTLRALAARAHRKGLEVVCNVQPDVPDALVGDAGRLRQVLLNLVGNAIKFTEKGEVVVQVEGEATAPASRQEVVLRFSVRDTGIGIPGDKQATIFRPCEQEDTSTTRKYGGTGLGLTIAARLVALMGGQISVSSTPGRGSTFVFTARFGLQPHPAEPTAAQPPVLLRDLPVLVIDDNATNRQILWEWLRGWHMDPVVAGDGVTAMDALWEAATRGRPYALVLLDARMPDTDGLALAAQIRKRAELSATRIILLTSGDRPGDWNRIRELRIDDHLLKPIPQDELLDRIYQVMSRARGDEPREAQPAAGRELATAPAPATTNLHILLAEDDEFSARFMEQLLARGGHRVRLTTNGREALSLAEEGAFDLLLLDIHMPGLDGFGVVGAIRERERATGGHLPVIALTARSRKQDRERCLTAGMDDFLTKPVAPAALLTAIDRLVSTHRVSRPSQADAGQRGSLLDPVAVLTACGDDAEGLRRVCQDFQTYAPARLAEVGDALRDRDAPRLRQAAHKFCPLLFAFSTVAGNVASDLEDHAAQGQLEEAQPLVERLEAMTQELMRLVGGLSLEALRRQAEATDERQPDRQPLR
jgi:two-component system sensor histidine kinase/response regulator